MAALYAYNSHNNYFAEKNDPGLKQQLDLSGNILSISNGNSVNLAFATDISTSKFKLTNANFLPGFNATLFTGDVRTEGSVVSAPPLGLGSATLNGGLANITITGNGTNNPSVVFEKSGGRTAIVYDGTNLNMSSLHVSTMIADNAFLSTVKLGYEVLDSFGNPGAAGQQLQSSGPGLPVVWGAGSGVGLTSVVAGSNIYVDNTNPISPVVNLSTSVSVPNRIETGTNLGMKVRMETDQVNAFGFMHFLSANTVMASVNYIDNTSTISMIEGRNGTVVLGSYNGITSNSLLQLKGNNTFINTSNFYLDTNSNGMIEMGAINNPLNGPTFKTDFGGNFQIAAPTGSINNTAQLNYIVNTTNAFGQIALNTTGAGININSNIIETQGSNLIVNSDVSIKGSDASLNFYNTSGVEKATINYAEINDKLTTAGSNLVFDTGISQLIMTNAETTINSASLPIKINSGSDIVLSTTTSLNVFSVNNNLTLDGATGNSTWTTGGLATLNYGGGLNLNTPNFSADTFGGGYAAIGDLQGNNNLTKIILNDSAPSVDIDVPFGNLTVNASAVIMNTQGNTAGYNFENMLRYTNGDTQLVDANKEDQVPTNQIAVPKFQVVVPIPANSINPTNPPLAPFYVSDPFAWRYSGTGVGSVYCRAERVEVDVDITVLGAAMDDPIQWGIVMFDIDSGTPYNSVGAFRSFDDVNAATGLEYSTLPKKSNPTGRFNHTASIRCFFDGVNNIPDGNSVVFRVYAISFVSPLVSEDGNISWRIRPTTRVP